MRLAILPSALPAMATSRLALTTGKSPEPVLIAIAEPALSTSAKC
jgi:hypothetical protein